MPLSTLTTLSPLDGRYAEKLEDLRHVFTEYGLIYYRLYVEIHWLKALAAMPEIEAAPALSEAAIRYLDKILENFSLEDGRKIRTLEKTNNHDVKAVEYYLKDRIKHHPELAKISEFIHFACTSEDINNLSYGMMLLNGRNEIILPRINDVVSRLRDNAHEFADVAMLARTHGQAASPTTMGKEFANFVARLDYQVSILRDMPVLGKFNGAVGNFNAHVISYPEIDWMSVSKNFVESLDLTWNPYTTQIEPHDNLAEMFQAFIRINNILIDCCRDLWGYISLGYLVQAVKAEEVGSSTMPHKINPISFENAEGNLGLANALLDHFANKLTKSRWQRDLSDSTVLRNIGVALGHCYLAYDSFLHGINKLSINELKLREDLENNWAVLAEALQTIMRRYQVEQPYEQLKALTRGNQIKPADLQNFIAQLELPAPVKTKLMSLQPSEYIGYASELARGI